VKVKKGFVKNMKFLIKIGKINVKKGSKVKNVESKILLEFHLLI